MYRSRSITIGNLTLGGDSPVRIQSMTNTPTGDITTTVEQCKRILRAGSDLVRITVRNLAEANILSAIKEQLKRDGFNHPLAADVHFNPELAYRAAKYADKVRINPGNFADSDFMPRFLKLLKICSKHNTAIRIGVNHGSLSERIMLSYGDSPEGMVESAMEYLRICKQEDFKAVVISLKSSNTYTMIHANRLLVKSLLKEDMDYPIHLGITEAGAGEDGRMKSAIGIATLLSMGIGDTIRVSLTEKPENEIPFAILLAQISSVNRPSTIEDLKELPPLNLKRKSLELHKIGNKNLPVVISSTDPVQIKTESRSPDLPAPDSSKDKSHTIESRSTPDLFFNNESRMLTYTSRQHQYPDMEIIKVIDLMNGQIPAERPFLVECTVKELNDDIINTLKNCENAGLLINIVSNDHSLGITKIFNWIDSEQLYNPVILKLTSNEKEKEKYLIQAAVYLGRFFIDGSADGIWLENNSFDPGYNTCLAFNLLQSSRARMSATEYIACPSCGRTLFDIEKVLSKLQESTSHLKHLKIAVMGCIVNGPGEMADADYGYVGSGAGKITLYKSRDPVKKNIPEEKAIEELIHLIKENNDWSEP